uniref:Permease n=1 Tax=Solibacter usitatus (strain Ellin6076) TaxID=234267 RepID=Q01WQ7_SOLUE
MTLIPRFRSLIAGILRRKIVESSMEDEMSFHIEAYTRDLIRSGVPPAEAERRARIEFGGVEVYKEQCREARGLRMLDDLRADLRYACRTLAKSPSFSLTAILTLALGIGANTGLFTMMDTLLLRPVPVHDPSSLYQVFGHSANRTKFGSFSIREYHSMIAANQVFTQVIADLQVRARFQNRGMGGYAVSGNYFQALGGGIALGRPILPEDELPSAPPVVVLSHARWQGTFNGDPGIVGKTIELSGNRFAVIGVASTGFTGLDPVVPDFWAPLSAKPLFTGSAHVSEEAEERSLRIVGRLRPGVTETQAQSGMSVLLPRVSEARQKEMQFVDAALESRATYQSWNHADLANVLPVVSAFALVLLIACTNLSNVLLARALNRSREIGVRLSLGASRSRIVRQLVTETAVLSLIAGAVGLAMSHSSWTLIRHVIVSSFSMKTEMPIVRMNPDYRVFVFAFLLSLATGIVFGLVPALHATRSTLNSALRAEGALLGSRFRRSRLRDGLVIAQFAFSLVLLIGASLLLHSTIKVGSVQPGFDVAHSIGIEPIQGTYSPNPMLIAQLRERLQSMPGARAVAAAMREPLRGSLPIAHVSTGSPQFRVLDARYNEVTPEYFSVLEIPLVRGRAFTSEEAGSGAPVAVISEATAMRFWPGDDPMGKIFEVTTPEYSSRGRELLRTGSRTVQVIGIAKDVVSAWLSDGVDATCVYLPAKAGNSAYYSLLVRVFGDPRPFVPALRNTLASVDPSIEFDVRTMADVMDFQVLPLRLASWGAAILALLGLTLASIGIYGVMAYTVNQRTREIGIRMALGADADRVLWMNLREGLRLIAIATGGGLIVAFALSRVMGAMLFRLGATGPAPFVIASAVLSVVGLLAIYFPSRQATRVDPSVALRFE